jgi:hypothetical protein
MFTYIHIHVLDDPQDPLPYETFVQYIQRKGQRQGTQSEIRMLTKNISEYEILCTKNASNTSVRSAHSVNNKNVLGVLREDKDRMLSETFSEKHENELLKLNSTNLKEEPAPLHTDNRYPVIPTGLGYFHKVSSERLKLKNGTSKARVTCTCETFRRRGTCDETKLVRLVCHNYYPPLSCASNLFTGWDQVKSNLMGMFASGCSIKKTTYGKHASAEAGDKYI